MNKLSANIKKLLLNAKISENELARKTGVAQQIINRMLSGENQNPKISTLSPIANYFMVSISQLIGDDIYVNTSNVNIHHLGWREIPMLEWDLLARKSLDKIIMLDHLKIPADIDPCINAFAVKMSDHSMGPQFTKGTILIFDPNKKPSNGDFVLLETAAQDMAFRQLFLNKDNCFIKCMNPDHSDYKMSWVGESVGCRGVLIQSRTDHALA